MKLKRGKATGGPPPKQIIQLSPKAVERRGRSNKGESGQESEKGGTLRCYFKTAGMGGREQGKKTVG